MEINQTVMIPWFTLADGLPDVKRNKIFGRAIANEHRKTGKKFFSQGTGAGLIVTRIS